MGAWSFVAPLIKDHEPANFAQNEAKHQADDLSSNKKDDQELESPSLVILYNYLKPCRFRIFFDYLFRI